MTNKKELKAINNESLEKDLDLHSDLLQQHNITLINEDCYITLLERLDNDSFTKDDKKRYIMIDKKDNLFIAIDNLTSDLWVEEFETIEDVVDYLE